MKRLRSTWGCSLAAGHMWGLSSCTKMPPPPWKTHGCHERQVNVSLTGFQNTHQSFRKNEQQQPRWAPTRNRKEPPIITHHSAPHATFCKRPKESEYSHLGYTSHRKVSSIRKQAENSLFQTSCAASLHSETRSSFHNWENDRNQRKTQQKQFGIKLLAEFCKRKTDKHLLGGPFLLEKKKAKTKPQNCISSQWKTRDTSKATGQS